MRILSRPSSMSTKRIHKKMSQARKRRKNLIAMTTAMKMAVMTTKKTVTITMIVTTVKSK